ncbi:hypothetical protein IFM89_028896 [Coptis chinensis]|uniref:inositol-3-phosphate synthase n=1 Tax=Coptis chinensis TaxID=261450 RepID=A0A835H7H6_9MAGN|nr:hypothetical protein IFM89_028896 [Coptis chinensis]
MLRLLGLLNQKIEPTSIVSYNHLGNNDGMNLSAPRTFGQKEISKVMLSATWFLAMYVPYVGDSKRAMDEYTLEIFMGGKSIIVMHNTCEDSLLAAAIILDLVPLLNSAPNLAQSRRREGKFHSFHLVATILGYLTKAPRKANMPRLIFTYKVIVLVIMIASLDLLVGEGVRRCLTNWTCPRIYDTVGCLVSRVYENRHAPISKPKCHKSKFAPAFRSYYARLRGVPPSTSRAKSSIKSLLPRLSFKFRNTTSEIEKAAILSVGASSAGVQEKSIVSRISSLTKIFIPKVWRTSFLPVTSFLNTQIRNLSHGGSMVNPIMSTGNNKRRRVLDDKDDRRNRFFGFCDLVGCLGLSCLDFVV